ncbi:MAG: helix-turn-helix domain-containing protein [Novosphingobium sp.]
MLHNCTASGPDATSLAEIKRMSGRRIEDERRREGLTQSRLGELVGLGVSWIREIESGNPKTRIDDHLRCAAALQISPSIIFLPMLFQMHGLTFIPQLLSGNLYDFETQWLEFIVNQHISAIRRLLGLADDCVAGERSGSAFPQLGSL